MFEEAVKPIGRIDQLALQLGAGQRERLGCDGGTLGDMKPMFISSRVRFAQSAD
jgi:hypothetical protein